MGIYINPGNENLRIDLNSKIFIDKSLFIKKISELINTDSRFICVSRPRRFGKTRIGSLLKAYFSKGCDSREMFSNLKIAADPCFGENLNKFNVLSFDLGGVFSSSKDKNEIKDSAADLLMKVYRHTNTQFIIIIDEYDVLVREQIPEHVFKGYLEFLNSLFKNNELSPAIAFAYLTGILPIVRDKVQSKLNIFKESTMLMPFGMEEFFGFTKAEVKALCDEYGMNFSECEKWYDGYKIGALHIYNPNSLVEAMMRRKYANYWQISGSYEAVSDYIKLDFDGVKGAIVEMLSDRQIRINPYEFSNSLTDLSSKDDVFTYLVHLGYLNYDEDTELCRIPNREIRQEWEKALKKASNFSKIAELIRDSEELLELVQNGEAEEAALALDRAHTEVSSIKSYNREASLQAAIMIAFYTARTKYTIIQELPAGYGFADIGFIPLNKKDPAMIIELKCNHDAETAIKQIKDKKYPKALENYLDNLLLVAVNYDKKTKVHECVIEKYKRAMK